MGKPKVEPLWDRIARGGFPPLESTPHDLLAFAREGINPCHLTLEERRIANARHKLVRYG
jgi:hypothetical protein